MPRGRFRAPAPVRVVFDGQSMNVIPSYPDNAPWFAMSGRNIPWANVAINGQGWYDLTPTINTRLAPQARNRAGCIDVLVMNGGQGDVLNASPSGGQTGAVCYQRAIDYADLARDIGFQYVILATWSAWGADMLGTGRPTPAEAAARSSYNALALANSGGFDAVADVSVAPLNDATNLDYFQFDRLHLSQDGAKIMGSILWKAIASLGL
jgi:lysophospholipase L1-like esterase